MRRPPSTSVVRFCKQLIGKEIVIPLELQEPLDDQVSLVEESDGRIEAEATMRFLDQPFEVWIVINCAWVLVQEVAGQNDGELSGYIRLMQGDDCVDIRSYWFTGNAWKTVI